MGMQSDAHSSRWRVLARWLLAAVVCGVSFLLALATLFLIPSNERLGFRLLDASWVHPPVAACLELFALAGIVAALSVWILPTALAISSAVGVTRESGIRYGLTLTLLLACTYFWFAKPLSSPAITRSLAITSAALLLCGAGISFVSPGAKRLHFISIAAGALVLVLPFCVTFAAAPRDPPDAKRLWSTSLDPNPWQSMNTGSSYGSTRQAVFAGDRILAVFDSGSAPYEGKEPMARYRLVSLELQTGAARESREFIGKWGNMPALYATGDEHAIFSYGDLESLNPNLSPAGPRLALDRGRVGQISPDGATLAWETNPGTTLLDARTLLPLPGHISESVPTSVNSRAVLTDNIYWYGDYPNDRFFVTLTDSKGQHLLYHGKCGERPQFLSEGKVIILGCGVIRILDLTGKILHETKTSEGSPTFAGVSRNGSRFAVGFTTINDDPPAPLYEHFVIYDTETTQALAIVRIKNLPEYNSWFAFAPDGRTFVAGSPYNLSLYALP
ncbi:MAG TPA: hypothetical protein VMI93_04940 [Candidatus Solibacter sp.]|nr:hypothetical protein [Candidatus Solibacter sp.]